jgi:hypothetical protein
MGGVHLPLYGTFVEWLRKTKVGKAHAAAWEAIADKQKFFVNLAAVCFSGNGAPSAFSYCFTIDRHLTAAALPALLKRADGLTEADLRPYCYAPPETEKITSAQTTRRQMARKANARFLEATEKKPRRITEVNQ